MVTTNCVLWLKIKERHSARLLMLCLALIRSESPLLKPIETMCGPKECIDQIDGTFFFMDPSHLRRNMPEHVYKKLADIVGLGKALLLKTPLLILREAARSLVPPRGVRPAR